MGRKTPDIKPKRNLCEHNWIPIVYGYPSQSMFDLANAGEIKLGGCVVRDNSHTLYCTKCGLSK